MVGLPINFALPGEGSIASYDWTEIASGEGYKTFYLMSQVTESGQNYIISSKILESYVGAGMSPIKTGGSTDLSATPTITFSSSTFNRSDFLRGKCFIILKGCTWTHPSSGGGRDMYLEVILKLVSGETTIVLGSSKSQSFKEYKNQSRGIIFSSTINISGQKVSEGDYLELQVISTNLNFDNIIVLGHEPTDAQLQNGSAVVPAGFTASKIHIPFRIDL